MILTNSGPNYRQCSISVMDNIAGLNITFDDKGICNYYNEYLKNCEENVYSSEKGTEEWIKLQLHSNFEVEQSICKSNPLTKKIGKILKRM